MLALGAPQNAQPAQAELTLANPEVLLALPVQSGPSLVPRPSPARPALPGPFLIPKAQLSVPSALWVPSRAPRDPQPVPRARVAPLPTERDPRDAPDVLPETSLPRIHQVSS